MEDREWQALQPEIQRLYINENKTLSQVVELIESKFGFRRTTSQYERRLKRWGLVKNQKVSDTEWKFVGIQIHKRKLNGKHKSDVYKNGKRVPPGTVKAAVYGGKAYISTADLAREPSPSTPGGIVVCSPRSPKSKLQIELPHQQLSLLDPLNSYQGLNMPSHLSTTTALFSTEATTQLQDVKRGVRESHSGIVPCDKLDCSPSIQGYNRNATALKQLTLDNHNKNPKDNAVLKLCQGSKSNLPGLKTKLSLASNGLALDDAQMMETLRETNLNCFVNFRTLLLMSEPTAAAIAEKFFASALRVLDSEAVGMMLVAGIDPNRILSSRFSTGSTYLQHAAGIPMEKGFRIAQLLLSHGANPNLTFNRELALCHAIRNTNNRTAQLLLSYGAVVDADCLAAAAKHIEDMDLFNQLLAVCPDVNPAKNQLEDQSALAEAVLRQNVNMTTSLLQRGAQPRYTAYVETAVSETGKTSILGLTIQTERPEIIKPILQACKGTPTGELVACDIEDFVSPLAIAVESGKSELVDLLIGAGADVRSAGESQGLTLMERAVTLDDFQMCKVLVGYGAQVDRPSPNSEPHSALSIAVESNSVDIVSLLLRAGGRVNDHYIELPETVLATAIECGSPALVGLLLNAGARHLGTSLRWIRNLDTATYLHKSNLLQRVLDTCGARVLAAAILSRNDELARFLLDRTFDVNERGTCSIDETTPLSAAIKTCNISLASSIIARGAIIRNADFGAAVEYCLAYGGNELFHFMLCHFPGNAPTAVGRIVLAKRQDLLHCLLSKGITPGGIPTLPEQYWRLNDNYIYGKPRSALEIAALEDNLLMLRTLLQSYPWTKTLKGRALSLALLFGREEVAEYLLGTNPDMNREVGVYPLQRDDEGKLVDWGEYRSTPLQAAAENQDISMVEKLLKNPTTNINFLGRGATRRTALQLAVKSGNMSLVAMLLKHGADVNAQAAKNNGVTALQCAAIQGSIAIAQRLIEHGAEIDTPGKGTMGRSALEGAAENGRIDMVRMLLDKGASVLGGAGETQYKRALRLAENAGHYAVAELIRAFRHQLEMERRPVMDLADGDGML